MIKMIKYFFLLLILTGSMVSYAQYENTSGGKQQEKKSQEKRQPLKKPPRWFAGGMLGAGFSSYSSYVEVAPIVGYKVTRDFHVGTRITYIYNSYLIQTGPQTDKRVNLHHYGGSLFARYVFLRFLMAHAEYEMLSYDYYEDREWINSLFLGGGYYQNIGGRSFASFLILFNVLDSPNSPYANPIFRIGFGIGF